MSSESRVRGIPHPADREPARSRGDHQQHERGDERRDRQQHQRRDADERSQNAAVGRACHKAPGHAEHGCQNQRRQRQQRGVPGALAYQRRHGPVVLKRLAEIEREAALEPSDVLIDERAIEPETVTLGSDGFRRLLSNWAP